MLKNKFTTPIITTILGAVFLASFWFLFARIVRGVSFALYEGPQHIEETRGIPSQVNQMQQMLDSMYRDTLMKSGIAIKGGFGSNEVSVLINTLSRANAYSNHEKMLVYNLSHEKAPSMIVKIVGTFRDIDENILIRLSARASQDLEVKDEEKIRVRIALPAE